MSIKAVLILVWIVLYLVLIIIATWFYLQFCKAVILFAPEIMILEVCTLHEVYSFTC